MKKWYSAITNINIFYLVIFISIINGQELNRIAIYSTYINENSNHKSHSIDNIEQEFSRQLSKYFNKVEIVRDKIDIFDIHRNDYSKINDNSDYSLLLALLDLGTKSKFAVNFIEADNGIVLWSNHFSATTPSGTISKSDNSAKELTLFLRNNRDNLQDGYNYGNVIDFKYSNNITKGNQIFYNHILTSVIANSSLAPISILNNSNTDNFPKLDLMITKSNEAYISTIQKWDPLIDRTTSSNRLFSSINEPIENISRLIVDEINELISGNVNIIFNSIPIGAQFWIDEQYYGKTPVTISTTSGFHRIKMQRSGFLPLEKKIVLHPGMTDLNYNLTPPYLIQDYNLEISTNSTWSQSFYTGKGNAKIEISLKSYNGLLEIYKEIPFIKYWWESPYINNSIGEIRLFSNNRIVKTWDIPLGKRGNSGQARFPQYELDYIYDNIRYKIKLDREFLKRKTGSVTPVKTYGELKSIYGQIIVERTDVYQQDESDVQVIDIY